MFKLFAPQNDIRKIVVPENFDIEVLNTHHILFDVDSAAACLTYDDSIDDTFNGEGIVFGDYHHNYIFWKSCFEVI